MEIGLCCRAVCGFIKINARSGAITLPVRTRSINAPNRNPFGMAKTNLPLSASWTEHYRAEFNLSRLSPLETA
jgi:hypothetical protein